MNSTVCKENQFLSLPFKKAQGLYTHWKTWKFLEFYCSFSSSLEKGYWFWKVLEIY